MDPKKQKEYLEKLRIELDRMGNTEKNNTLRSWDDFLHWATNKLQQIIGLAKDIVNDVVNWFRNLFG